MDYIMIRDKLVAWLQHSVRDAKADGLVIGLSGGIDSSVAAALSMLAFPKQSFGLIMPCYSHVKDSEDALLLAQAIGLPYKTVILDHVYDEIVKAINPHCRYEESPMSYANVKPRLRMTALYFEASLRNYLVLGTGNKSEFVTGYFTKYGDGGVDLEPLGELLKTDVKELARLLGLPDRLITKNPSAGLWENQTDEQEMGFSYADLDTYIKTGEGSKELVDKVMALNSKSQHKKNLPPTCPLDLHYKID